jgi:hypothetical protein
MVHQRLRPCIHGASPITCYTGNYDDTERLRLCATQGIDNRGIHDYGSVLHKASTTACHIVHQRLRATRGHPRLRLCATQGINNCVPHGASTTTCYTGHPRLRLCATKGIDNYVPHGASATTAMHTRSIADYMLHGQLRRHRASATMAACYMVHQCHKYSANSSINAHIRFRIH